MRTKLLAAATCLAFVAFAPVPSVYAAAPNMAVLDPDTDGTVSLVEAQKAGESKFKAADTDNDGTLDAKEASIDVKAADPDKDGTLDAKEYSAAIASAFKAADPDNDGTLDAKELSSAAGQKLVGMVQ